MANTNKPFGLRPYSNISGHITGGVRMFYVPATDTTAFYVGDTVKLAGTEGSLNSDDLPMPTVTKAATSDAVVGVCVGVIPTPTSVEFNYRKASTGMYVLVACDPNTIFVVQGDADTYDAADVGFNMTLTVSTGSATTGLSNAVADQDSAADTSTLALAVMGTLPSPDNDLTGGYPLLLVKLNNHQFANAATGL